MNRPLTSYDSSGDLAALKDTTPGDTKKASTSIHQRLVSSSTFLICLGVFVGLVLSTMVVFLGQIQTPHGTVLPSDSNASLESQQGCTPTSGTNSVSTLPFWIDSTMTSIKNTPVDPQDISNPFTVVCLTANTPWAYVYHASGGPYVGTWPSTTCTWNIARSRYEATFDLTRQMIDSLQPGNYYIYLQAGLVPSVSNDYTFNKAVSYNCNAGTFTKRDLWWEEFSMFGEDYWDPCQSAGGCAVNQIQYRELACRSETGDGEPLWEDNSLCNGIPLPTVRNSRECSTKPSCLSGFTCSTTTNPLGECVKS